MSGPQGGEDHRENWTTGTSGQQGGEDHREECAKARRVPQGGVCLREERTKGMSGPQGRVSHLTFRDCLESPNYTSHESLWSFPRYAPVVEIRRPGIT